MSATWTAISSCTTATRSSFWFSARGRVLQGPLSNNSVPLTQGPLSQVLEAGRPHRDREFTLERANSTIATLLANLDPLFDEAGQLIGGVCVLQDITRRKRVETIRRERERQFRDLLQALPVALYTTDADGRLTFYNQATVDLWGHEPKIDNGLDDIRWCGSWRLYSADGRDLRHDECPMAVAIQGQREIGDAEAQLERPDGTRIPFIGYPTLLRDKGGKMIGAVNIMIDISERKRAEVEQNTMIDELNHRVKDTFATVQSVAAQIFRKAQVPHEIRDLFEKRIFALSKARNQLSSTRWTSADLKSLAREILEAYHDEDDGESTDRIIIDGPSVNLAPHAALTIAMALRSIVARDGDKEGIPVSLIEAMACGVPVIATDNGGIPELLEGGAGLIVPERDVPALTAAMARLMEDVPLHVAMIAKARERIESEYDLKTVVDCLERGFTRGHL